MDDLDNAMEKVIGYFEADYRRSESRGALLVYVGRKTAKAILDLLKEQEAIVRCKDCKHYDQDAGRCYWGVVHGNAETWFCADGERQEGGEANETV